MSDNNNLDAEQTEKIVHFQEVTHIDSIEECRHLLEAHNWNVELAVQSTFNDNFNNGPATSTSASSSNTSSMATGTTAGFGMDQINQILFNNTQNYHQLPQSPSTSSLPNSNSSNNLPSINILTQRNLSYFNQPVVPRGVFQWTYFIISIPIRFLYVTLSDIFGFVMKLFVKNDSNDDATQNYDPLANIVEFIVDFNQKYGADNHPNFFEGSYGQAVNEVKRNFRFLLVYLHDNENQDCNKFVTETLSNPDVIDYLNQSVVLWACSKQLPEGRKVYSALKAKRCPFLGLIVQRGYKMTLVSRIEGPIGSGELVLQLSQMLNDYQGDLSMARIEREQYTETAKLREQQDQAYAECLRQDQENSRKKRELEEAKRREEEEERQRAEEEQRKIQDKLNLKVELKKNLPKEPEASDANAIKLLLKLPSGRRLERLFLKIDPAKNLFNFLFCDDECPLNFEIVTNFPRKVIQCTHETEQTLAECGITQSMLLFVNDLDA